MTSWIARLFVLGVSLLLASTAVIAAQEAGTPDAAIPELELVVGGLAEPVFVTNAADDRLFVVERQGVIRIVTDGNVLDTPFLDITGRVGSDSSEQGLLGLAFPSNHAETGLFYVDYTDLNGDTVVSRFQVSVDSDRADPTTEEVVLTQDQPAWNHNGGMIAFGPDGYLYIGLGDGGGQGDPDGNGQRADTWLGKILRINVDPDSSGNQTYSVPDDNPYVGDEDALPEIWASGLRNPWRFSFDRETGDLWIADVGQNEFEEVNVIGPNDGGANFGWNLVEGPSCFADSDCNPASFVEPVFTYTHSSGDGCSVTGGYVSHGQDFADLNGVYLFADYCTGKLWRLFPDGAGGYDVSDPIETGLNVSSFGEGADSRLYVVDLSGAVYELVQSR